MPDDNMPCPVCKERFHAKLKEIKPEEATVQAIEVSTLWDIVKDLAQKDPTFSTDMGDIECSLCNSDENFDPFALDRIKHEAECPYARAKAIVQQQREEK